MSDRGPSWPGGPAYSPGGAGPAGPPPQNPPPQNPPPQNSGTQGPSAPSPQSPSTEYLPVSPPAERFRLAWQSRARTDYIFGFWTALGWTLLTFGIYGLYVFYQLVRRLRDHNARRLELLDAAVNFGWQEAGRRGLQSELTPSFQRAAAHLAVLRKMTTDFREPVVWLLLSLIASGIVHVVAFILLDQDLINHDRAEVGVEYELALIFGRLGYPVPYPDQNRVKKSHKYVARIVVVFFTFGLYFLWWYHDMMVEPNRHFYANWSEEDTLAAVVQAML
jgi:Domain of unknown function (DUF4234)